MTTKQASRRQAREITLQILFQKEFLGTIDLDASLKYFGAMGKAADETLKYAEHVLKGIEKNQTELDSLISQKSRNWSMERMSPVDKSLLRIGAFELYYGADEVPPKVAIDEAIELAKRYGGSESSQFVNGILDEILKQRSKSMVWPMGTK